MEERWFEADFLVSRLVLVSKQLTANERVKMTDFGFARIAARNEEEMRRISFCGTDGYMSPEILTGAEFDLPTDVFSLGIIVRPLFLSLPCYDISRS